MGGIANKVLLKVAKAVLQQVLQGLQVQLKTVEDSAMQPMRTAVEQVMNGAWRGVGADAFVDEVSNISLPGAGVVRDHINTFHGNLVRAQEIMEEADRKAQQSANQLVEIFRAIYH